MPPLTVLPSVNAALNTLSAFLLALGYFYIRAKQVSAHRACMLGAFASSTLFLILYVFYHIQVGSVRFPGQGWIRTVYLSILLSHSVCAALVVPLALRTLYLAWKQSFDRHARLARWVLPLWLYVSVTGVVVYWMLYRVRWEI